MTDMNRRDAVQAMAAGTALTWTARHADRASRFVRSLGASQDYTPKNFTAHEYDTVRVLVDLIIPRDEKSGSATDAGVPQFMDFMLGDRPQMQTPMKGGLAWLDAECEHRFGKTFVDCAPEQQTAVLDDIAWPAKAPKDVSQGVAFFNRFRDLTCSGYYSSKMGVADLQYIGNVYNPGYDGCPPAQLKKLGVSYSD